MHACMYIKRTLGDVRRSNDENNWLLDLNQYETKGLNDPLIDTGDKSGKSKGAGVVRHLMIMMQIHRRGISAHRFVKPAHSTARRWMWLSYLRLCELHIIRLISFDGFHSCVLCIYIDVHAYKYVISAIQAVVPSTALLAPTHARTHTHRIYAQLCMHANAHSVCCLVCVRVCVRVLGNLQPIHQPSHDILQHKYIINCPHPAILTSDQSAIWKSVWLIIVLPFFLILLCSILRATCSPTWYSTVNTASRSMIFLPAIIWFRVFPLLNWFDQND
jgi:hypothetical protein